MIFTICLRTVLVSHDPIGQNAVRECHSGQISIGHQLRNGHVTNIILAGHFGRSYGKLLCELSTYCVGFSSQGELRYEIPGL